MACLLRSTQFFSNFLLATTLPIRQVEKRGGKVEVKIQQRRHCSLNMENV